MKIIKVKNNKKAYLDLLLLADEQEDMIDKYLERGDMFLLEDDGIKSECVVTKEEEGVYEIKNIATAPEAQKKGYATILINNIFDYYPDWKTFYVGTGDSPLTIPFYEKCGFRESHRVKNFFIDYYDHPMFEDGKQLIDMVYLRRDR